MTPTDQMKVPDLVDMLIVGGGPAGTAAAFRARELKINALLIDFDDILRRIRDYPKDKMILPDFGGGDKMAFPAGGECVAALQFEPIDKDDMHVSWKAMHEKFGIPSIIGLELTGATRNGDVWEVATWNHRKKEAGVIRAKHVVIAIGRGVPRRLDLSGNTEGLMYRMDDPAKYCDEPVLVIGGGTSAAEAVLAISNSKIAANDPSPVFWSFRGAKLPLVSKALAEPFFEAFVGNGNIRTLPDSEPVGIVTGPDKKERLSLKVDRRTPEGRPPESTHYEFSKHRCIACIGEDLPEKLLKTIGIEMIPLGAAATSEAKKMMAVSPLLETVQKNIYLIGDLLSQSYLEVDDFTAPPETFRQVKHRGNVKTSLRDGVFVADVIKQKLDGKAQVNVEMKNAAPVAAAVAHISKVVEAVNAQAGEQALVSEADATPATVSGGSLVLMTQAGIEAGEFNIKAEGSTTIGRINADVSFQQDTWLSDAHASISMKGGEYFLRDDGSRTGTYLKVRPDHPMKVASGDLLRVGKQILVIGESETGAPQVDHYSSTGAHIGSHPVKGTIVFGRSGGKSNPDVLLDENDSTLSRFHMSIAAEKDGLSANDFNSRNGTYLKVDAERKLEHGDVIRVGTQLLEVHLREELPEKTGSSPVPVSVVMQAVVLPPPPPPPAPAAAATGPFITFQKQGKSGPLEAGKTILAWADENEVEIDYECWAGMCGCDAIRIISGAEHLNPVTEKEIKTLKRKGLEPGPCRLACMCKASGPVVVDVA
jgi:thioredoxin reductase/ferredoxin